MDELEKNKEKKGLEELMGDWKAALIKQYWDKMTRYVKE